MLLQNFHDSDSTPGGFVGGLEENYPIICADGWLAVWDSNPQLSRQRERGCVCLWCVCV